jgi:hypothetical protein
MMVEPWTNERNAKVSRLIRSLYDVVNELEEEFIDEERKFTLDGHLVGSIGEVVAAYTFGLTLYPPGKETHDAEAENGRKVQIKLTGGIRGIALSSKPDYLIVLQLRDLKFSVVYNGPGAPVWERCGGNLDAPGQHPIGLRALRELQPETPSIAMKEHGLPDLSGNPNAANI